MARFLVEEVGRPTRSYRLVTDAIVIGRIDTADLVLPDTGVSRKHALVEREADAWVIADNESANGIQVNGQGVAKVALAHGDVVTIGKFTLTFQTDDESDLPEYTDPSAGGGDYQTSPGVPMGDLETMRSIPRTMPAGGLGPDEVDTLRPPPVVPPPVVHGPMVAHLVAGDGERFDIGQAITFGKDVPVNGVIPFLSAGEIVSDGDGARAKRGSFLIPLYVNGVSVTSHRLHDGDELRVGSTRLTYHGP